MHVVMWRNSLKAPDAGTGWTLAESNASSISSSNRLLMRMWHQLRSSVGSALLPHHISEAPGRRAWLSRPGPNCPACRLVPRHYRTVDTTLALSINSTSIWSGDGSISAKTSFRKHPSLAPVLRRKLIRFVALNETVICRASKAQTLQDASKLLPPVFGVDFQVDLTSFMLIFWQMTKDKSYACRVPPATIETRAHFM